MKQVLGFGGSNSKNSINASLVRYILSQLEGVNTHEVVLIDYDIPMYGIDLEQEKGIPIDVQLLKNEIEKADGLVISVNEHNGSWSAYFKSVFDWLTRADRNFLDGKKILLSSTSPGARGASSSLDYAKSVMPRFGGTIVESFSFPSFQDHLDVDKLKITDDNLRLGVSEVIASFLNELSD